MNPINPEEAPMTSENLDKKRILFVEANTDGTVGGSHLILLELIKSLDRNKFIPFVLFHQENVLVPNFKKICAVIILDKKKGLVIKRDLPHLYAFAGKIPILLYFLLLFQKTYNFFRYYLTDLFRVIYILLRNRIDLVHINNGPFLNDWLIACKLLRIKCLSYFRGTIKIPGFIKKKLIRFYDCVIPSSNAVTENARNQGVNTANFVLIYDGINTEAFLKKNKRQVISVRKEFQQDTKNPLIGVINNIKDWKGQHVAIEAVTILKDKYPSLKCLLVGNVSTLEQDRKYLSYLKELVNRRNLSNNVLFTGYRSDVVDLICALDILLHTSLGNEGLPRVILEIMLLSKPIIASAVGPTPEMIEDEISGFLVPPNNPRALAEKIEYLISHSDIATRVGEMARKRVKDSFNIETNVRKTEDLYNQLLFQ